MPKAGQTIKPLVKLGKRADEVWKPIPGWEGIYEASTFGRVRSLDRMVERNPGVFMRVQGRVLADRRDSKGYRNVFLTHSGKRKNYPAARVIAMTFLGLQGGDTVDHIDRDRANDRLENLRIATASQNAANRRPSRQAKSGLTGAYMDRKGRWCSSIKVNGKVRWLGFFPTREAAAAAFKSASLKQFGEFSRYA